jgi:hypothetical protein
VKIQIDVHPAVKTGSTCHMHPVLSLHMLLCHTYLAHSTYGNLLLSHPQHWAGPLLMRKSDPVPIHGTPADDLWVPTQFLFPLSHWSIGGKAKHPLVSYYIGLLGPYLQHVISLFNTCSRRPTHRSLTDTDGGYHLEVAYFSHHSPTLLNRWSSAFL